MSIILIVAFGFVTFYMLYMTIAPFIGSQSSQQRFELLDKELGQIEELTERKKLLMDNLREIEFDLELDKISKDDYSLLKRRYERETIRTMRALDEIYGGRGWQERIDAALVARADELASTKPKKKKKSKKRKAAKPSTPAPAIEIAQGVCESCGAELSDSAKFCSECGTPTHRAAPETQPQSATI